eukprot:TRINITY_DN1067_c0_g2_i1.p1 TRINITY_DN1067_c0_g2~~TRINITY_DN1067_c0_g2_i1.p1  ORF type:complete len:274 (+),score=71.21 TRINITY_DN1067_c0_g2_i1:134-955(+)
MALGKMQKELEAVLKENSSLEQQIAALEVKWDAVKNTVTQLEGAQKNLQGQLSGMQEDKGTSSEQCKKLDKENAELKNLVEELQQKKKEIASQPKTRPAGASVSTTSGTTPSAAWINEAMVAKAKALHTYKAQQPGDLGFRAGEEIIIFNKDEDWWIGYLNGKTGIIPSNYVKITFVKEDDKGRKRMSTRVSNEELAELEKMRNQVLVFPPAPNKPAFVKGQGESAYKKYMIDRYRYEKWENSKLLFERHMSEGNKLAAAKIVQVYQGFARSV